MSLIKLVNKTRQTIRTELFKYGVAEKEAVTWVVYPKSETISFDKGLLTPLAISQIRRGFLVEVPIKK